jgi:hypothetical protein
LSVLTAEFGRKKVEELLKKFDFMYIVDLSNPTHLLKSQPWNQKWKTWLVIQYSMRFDLQAQHYINCGFAQINYLVLNMAVYFYKELNGLKSLVLCSTAEFYSENKTKRGKYIMNI